MVYKVLETIPIVLVSYYSTVCALCYHSFTLPFYMLIKDWVFFQVYVNDSSGMSDRARVFIYLLREDQRVRFILRQSPEEVIQILIL